MTVLITDAGLVGAHVARTLLDQGVGVLMYDPAPSISYVESVIGQGRKLFRLESGDVRDLPRILDLMLRLGVTRIFHPIGATGPSADTQPSLAFQIRVAGTLHLIEAARIRSLSRIVIASESDSWVPNPATPETGETGPVALPGTFDGALDLAAQIVSTAYHRWAGVNLVLCRLAGVYGRPPPGRGADDPLHHAVASAAAAEPEVVVSVQLPLRERVYVKDAALALREAIFVERPTTRMYDIGSGEVVGSSELSTAIQAALPLVRLQSDQTQHAALSLVDDRSARNDLGYNPTWTLTTAVQDIIAELHAYPARSI